MCLSTYMLTGLNVLQVVLLTAKHILPARWVLSDHTGDCSAREVANILQNGCVCLPDGLSSLEHILSRDGNELETITFVIDLARTVLNSDTLCRLLHDMLHGIDHASSTRLLSATCKSIQSPDKSRFIGASPACIYVHCPQSQQHDPTEQAQ